MSTAGGCGNRLNKLPLFSLLPERASMKVVGIDPAPKKGATIYDPMSPNNDGWSTISACDLPDHVSQLIGASGDLLICWDSPLTAGQASREGCYYERPIERFFQTQKSWNPPKGISVRAYAGCPHWAVSRASVGLPKVGRFDSGDLPLVLCAEGNLPANRNGKYIVEVHPAVAIWLLCGAWLNQRTNWLYKKDDSVRSELWECIASISGDRIPRRKPQDDDEFDAYVAYLLGTKWLAQEDVVLLGDEHTGSFLVPATVGLQNAFRDYVRLNDANAH
jgi:hypothetical protein